MMDGNEWGEIMTNFRVLRQTMIFKDEGSILQYVRDDTVVGDFMFVKDKNCVE